MQYTPNYNLITVEGTDVVNPLIQMNPNFTDIDAAMFANKQAAIGTATEITSGTVHSLTRLNPDSNYFRFTATSNWTAGDSMNIDGVNVSVFLTDGTLPGTGAYVINSEVFGIITGTRVTLFLTNPITSASDVSFDPTGTSLDPADTNVDLAIKDIDNDIQALNTTVQSFIGVKGSGTFSINVNAGANTQVNAASLLSGDMPDNVLNATYMPLTFQNALEPISFYCDGGRLYLRGTTAQRIAVKWIEFDVT